jgi:hypothetical protein
VFGDRRVVTVGAGDHWRLPQRLGDQQEPWSLTGFRRHETRHFVEFVPAGVDARGGLDAALERGYAHMKVVLPARKLDRRYLVVIARNLEQGRALTGDGGLEDLVALTDSFLSLSDTGDVVAQSRIIVLWPAFRGSAPPDRETTVTHELTHAALATRTGPLTPSWLVEGMAMYVSGDRRSDGGVPLRTCPARSRSPACTGGRRPPPTRPHPRPSSPSPGGTGAASSSRSTRPSTTRACAAPARS